jgi:chromosome partitioning protein
MGSCLNTHGIAKIDLYASIWYYIIYKGEKSMLISVAGEKGGTGKTTIATNLSVFYDDLMVLDTDIQSTFSKWAATRYENKDLKKIKCIHSYTENIQRKAFEDNLLDLKTRYKNVLVDSMGRASVELKILTLVSDIIIFPIKANVFDGWTIGRIDKIVGDARLFNKKLKAYFLLSQVPTNTTLAAKSAQESLASEVESLDVLETWIHDRKSYREAPKYGMSVVELSKMKNAQDDGKAMGEILRLSEEINGY